MSFYVVIRDRDDGDYDSVAAFQKDDDSLDAPAIEWAIQVIEYMREEHDEETFRIVELANVTDVIEKGVWSDDDDFTPEDLTEKLKAVFTGATFPNPGCVS